MHTRNPRSGRGFTLVELAAIVACAGVVASVCQPGLDEARTAARQIREATQLRGITQSQFMWAAQVQDRFVLPSLFDTENHTVAAKGRAKDTTAAIYAMLLWNGSVPASFFVSPAETNDHIKVDDDAVFHDPPTAVTPAKALWDPAFSVDFTGGKTGNASFPHLMPAEERLANWSSTCESNVVLHSSRAPEIADLAVDAERVVTRVKNPGSNTFAFWSAPKGKARAWTGHIAFGDGAVTLVERLIAIDENGNPVPIDTGTYAALRTRDPKSNDFTFDMPWWEEPGRPANNMVGIFTTAGEKKSDYTSIWD